jgi:Protein of unknown function, DUF547
MGRKMNIRNITVLILLVFGLGILLPAAQTPGLHNSWDALLQKHVKDGLVDYKGFHADRSRLNRYLRALENADITTYSSAEKLAFWINAYNAFTVRLILNHYPTKSIRKISRPWKQKIWKAAGRTLSLDAIEHKILRKRFKEPRIHFAVVCASIGCPDLQSFAYRADKIEQQLTFIARGFFASSKHFKLKTDGDRVIIYISKIFNWFGGDFGKNKKERAAFMLPYVDSTDAQKIKSAASIKFKYLGYDWNLNEKKKK